MLRWRPKTLRFRLVIWYGVASMLLLAGFTLTLYFYVQKTLARPLDYRLRGDVTEVMRRIGVRPDGRLLWDGRQLTEGEPWGGADPWFELWDAHGNLVRRVWPFKDSRVERLPVAPTSGRETLSVYSVAEDIRLRVLSLPFHGPPNTEGWMLRVMTLHEPVGDPLAALRWIIVITLPAVVALLVVGGFVITRHWLRPLEMIVHEANQISARGLTRLSIQDLPEELGRLAAVFNDTLDRLEQSFLSLDRFVADASHELRTPLTTLRSVGEVGLRRSRSADEYREIIGSMLEEAQRLEALIQRLLELATAEADAAAVQRIFVQLDEIVIASAGELGLLAEQKNQNIRVEPARCGLRTDPLLFRQALLNLIENAIKYNPEGAAITITMVDSPESCRVTVADEGPGVRPEHREHIAERFFRPDRGRGRDHGGFGLGLALTKAYMHVLGGSLTYEPVLPHGSRFHLTIPKS